jgi:hypothetical protein
LRVPPRRCLGDMVFSGEYVVCKGIIKFSQKFLPFSSNQNAFFHKPLFSLTFLKLFLVLFIFNSRRNV